MSRLFQEAISRRAFVGGMSASLIACVAPRRTWNKTTADVIIIGAGLAGLHAAQIIENAGYKVIIIEASDRTGGRLHTLYNLPGSPDAGGIEVGASYKRFHAIADRLGVQRYVPPPSPRGSLYNINGASLTAEQWPTASQNRLLDREKSTLPDQLLLSYLKALPQLKSVPDWMKPDLRAMDISVQEYLSRQGASPEAMRLINANLNGNDISEQSALHMIRSLAIFRAGGSGETQYVRGGSQRMTDAMAGALRSDILLRSPVSVIEDEGDGIEISLTDGRKYGARHVLCTVPFSVLRHMRVEAELPLAMRNMIANLPYTRASFAFIQAREPFWKTDGPPGTTWPETIWSDDPLLGRVFVLGDNPAMLKVWTNGKAADLVDSMDEAAVGDAMIRKIEAARPSAKGKLRFVKLFSWQKNPFARGIYHHIGAGQGADLAAAVQHTGQRLHFAGEHLAQDASGMEGALETGERAAQYILTRLG